MFGLWYISLAIQELRKYLGWTSVFDIFKSNNNKTDKNALQDNKPLSDTSTTSKTDDIVIKKPTEVPKIPEKKPDIKTTVPPQPTKPTSVSAEKVPDNKPVITQKPVVDLPKSVPVVEPSKPKTPEIEKPQSKPVTSKPTSPNPTVPASTNGLSSSSGTLDNKQNDFDKNIFGSSVENGDTTTKKTKNIKDATSSFLEEEGRGGTLKQKRDVSASSPR